MGRWKNLLYLMRSRRGEGEKRDEGRDHGESPI